MSKYHNPNIPFLLAWICVYYGYKRSSHDWHLTFFRVYSLIDVEFYQKCFVYSINQSINQSFIYLFKHKTLWRKLVGVIDGHFYLKYFVANLKPYWTLATKKGGSWNQNQSNESGQS